MQNRRRGTTAAAAGERVARSALPDFNANPASVNQSRKLHIGPIREQWMMFEHGSEPPRLRFARMFAHDDAMRVADGRRGKRKRLVGDIDPLIEDLATRPGDGDVATVEADASHVDGDYGAFVLHFARHGSSARPNLERNRFDESPVP